MGAALVVIVALVAVAVVGGIVVFLRRRLVRDLFAPGPQRRAAGLVMVATLVVTFGTILLARLAPGSALARTSIVGYLMLAVLFYLVLALLVLEAPRWALHRRARATSPVDGAGRHEHGDDRDHGHGHGYDHGHGHGHGHGHEVDADRRRTIARLLAGVAGLTAVGTTTFGFLRARDIRVKPVTVRMPRADPAVDGLRIAVLTDVHLTTGLRERSWMAETVERVNALGVDLVAIVGDLVDGSVDELGDDAAPLADLDATYGAVFVTGNHEFFSGADEWADFLPALGVRVLRNERVELERAGGTFDLAGVDDVAGERHSGGPDFSAALDGRDPERTVILLAHQPVLASEARDHGVDLQISGHTHGGQMWPIHYVVRLQQGHVAGLERLGDTMLYTSRGVGSWGPPVRVGAPPEISLLTLRAR